VLLSDHLAEGLGPVLPGEHEIGHSFDSKGALPRSPALPLAYNAR
jgi:hypothetical protein